MATPLLEINHLAIAFKNGKSENLPVKDVSFCLNKGETLALVGESGSGKSLTAHAIMKLLPYPAASHPQGEILFKGEDLLQKPLVTMRQIRGREIGMIFQEPMTALNPLHTIEKQIGEIISLHHSYDKSTIKQKVLDLLEEVRIPDAEKKIKAYPHELSGGQRQRVMIAMALANKPSLLIADEPTTALDVTVQKEILSLLSSLQQKYGMAMLFITHDLGVVKHISQRVAVMHQGVLVEQGPTADVFAHPQHTYTQSLLNNVPKGKPVLPPEMQKNLLNTKQLTVKFPTEKNLFGNPKHFFTAVSEVSIALKPGHTLGIVGESGSGKSTLAMAILKLITSSGEIIFNSQRLDILKEKAIRPLRKNLQIVFQDPFASLSPRMTVSEIVAEGLVIHKQLSPREIDNTVIDALKEVGVDPDSRHRYPHEFSGGQRQRISIARALILNPQLIILDEPTSALDRTIQVQVIELLKRLQRERQIAYLFISHDLKVIQSISHNIIVMKDGHIVEEGSTEKILTSPSQEYTRQLIDAALH